MTEAQRLESMRRQILGDDYDIYEDPGRDRHTLHMHLASVRVSQDGERWSVKVFRSAPPELFSAGGFESAAAAKAATAAAATFDWVRPAAPGIYLD